jgi:hypothetical protein
MAKKIKVQLTSKKSVYAIGGHIYRSGDVFEVEENGFNEACMVKIEKPKKKAEQPKEETEVVTEPKQDEVAEQTQEEAAKETVTPNIAPASAAPKVQKKRKT